MASRGWEGRQGACCLGEEAEKTVKGHGRERIWHSAQRQRYCSISPLTWPACLILERLCRNGDSLKLSPRPLARKGFVPKRPYWASQLRTSAAVGQLQAEGGGGPLAPKTAISTSSRRPSVLLHDLLTTNADGVNIGARATARVDLDPQFYLHKASGEAKPHLITDFVSDTVADTEDISLGPGATMKLTSGTKPKLHACPRRCGSLPMPASWQPSTTLTTWTTAPPKTTWPTRLRSVNWHRDTPGLRFWRMTKSADADRQQPGSDGGRTHSTCAQCY